MLTHLNIAVYGDQTYLHTSELKIPEWYEKRPIEGRQHFLANRIKEVGIKRPLVINSHPGRDGIIIDGVQVYLQAVALNISEVPVFLADIDPEEEGTAHVFYNTLMTDNSGEGLMRLTRMKYESYFIKNSEDEEILNKHADAVEAGKKAILNPRPLPKPGKRIMAALPPELAHYPKLAMEKLDCASINELIIKMLRKIVEGPDHE